MQLLNEQRRQLSEEAQVEAVCKWFPALTALVVGPGLGRDETLQAVAERIIERAIAEDLPVVIDADGLAIVTRRPALVRGSRWTVLTPNRPEYGRLSHSSGLMKYGVPTLVRARSDVDSSSFDTPKSPRRTSPLAPRNTF